jgi:hypothetical protein
MPHLNIATSGQCPFKAPRVGLLKFQEKGLNTAQALGIRCQIPRLSLVSNREREYDVDRRLVAVEREIPEPAARNDEFAEAGLGAPPDQRVPLEHADGLFDEINCLGHRDRVGFEQKVSEALETANRLLGVD